MRPQEEVVFAALLKILAPGAVIVEGGAYWAFYSMWFLTEVPSSRAFLIEPNIANIEIGKRNLAENRLSAPITRAYVGKEPGVDADGTPIVAVDQFARDHELAKIDLLHMDIQGAELDMLTGARQLLSERRIDYIFISTHSEALHADCVSRLRSHSYRVLASATPRQSFSYDGLIVAQSPSAAPLEFDPISLKS
jgi:hypothetical protein